MANFLSTTIETEQATLTGGESGLITQTGGFYVDGTDAIRATTGENSLVNDGYIYAFNGGNSAIDAKGSQFNLFNGQNGLITAEDPILGVLDIDTTFGTEIVNEGSIFSPSGTTIRFDASDTSAFFELDNSGTISASNGPAVSTSVGLDYTTVQNSGSITATSNAVFLTASATNGNLHVLDNSGSIVSTGLVAVTFAVGDNSVALINNSGMISGFNGGLSVVVAGRAEVTNSGIITATSQSPGSRAVDLTNGVDDLINSGTINGEVATRDDDDNVVNSGAINGEVDLGSGADSFKTTGNGFVSDMISGNAGNDTIRGGNFDDTIDGGTEDDLLRGKNGEDDLIGGKGNDTLFGGNGNDSLTGEDGDDDLRGGAGDDTLLGGGNRDLLVGGTGNDTMEGGSGNDTLRGGAGDDTIAGQNGSDEMSGGAGSDIFLFTSAGHSAIGNRDDILDFQQGQDKIDIDGLSNDTFVFLGNGAFTVSGDAEVRVTSNGAGNSVVRIDVDGDGNADSEIDVLGVTGLDAGDFIL